MVAHCFIIHFAVTNFLCRIIKNRNIPSLNIVGVSVFGNASYFLRRHKGSETHFLCCHEEIQKWHDLKCQWERVNKRLHSKSWMDHWRWIIWKCLMRRQKRRRVRDGVRVRDQRKDQMTETQCFCGDSFPHVRLLQFISQLHLAVFCRSVERCVFAVPVLISSYSHFISFKVSNSTAKSHSDLEHTSLHHINPPWKNHSWLTLFSWTLCQKNALNVISCWR